MRERTFELAFAKFIQDFQDQIKENFLEDAFHKRELLSHYQMGEKMINEVADGVLSDFVVNIDRRTPVEAMADRFIRLGMSCCENGVSFSEMIRVLVLLRRHIWLFFQDSNFAGQPFDVRSIVALNNRTTLFFDRAMYYFLVGMEQTLSEQRSEMEKFYDALLDRLRRDLGVRSDSEGPR